MILYYVIMENAEAILKQRREQDARRAREYYNRNKEIIAERRKVERSKTRELKEGAKTNDIIVSAEGKILN